MTANALSFQFGDKGGEVPAIQQQLIKMGYKPIPNEVFDKETKWAVRLFQKDRGLTVDGVVGPKTYRELMGKDISQAKPAKGKVLGTKRQKLSKNKNDEYKPSIVSKNASDILATANSFIGVPYVFGGTTPSGFDCSGYTRYVFATAGINLPRMADEQYRVGYSVPKNSLQPGDLVFFETYEPGISHSGIYMGNGQFISATSSRGVAIDTLMSGYWSDHYVGAKRVLK